MSHFAIFAILPKDADLNNVDAILSELLAPFDENERVEEYEEKCYCVGREAKNAGYGVIQRGIDAFMDTFHAKYGEAQPFSSGDTPERDELWEEHIAPLKKLEQETIDAHPMKDKPDPKCEYCNGTGKNKTTYNPQSKWDWWVIGGRWYQCWDKKYWADVAGGVSTELCHSAYEKAPLRGNVLRVDKLLETQQEYIAAMEEANWRLNDLPEGARREKNNMPFAILTPEGDWFAQGEMGWWAVVSCKTDMERYHREGAKLMERYKDHLAVVCDLHI